MPGLVARGSGPFTRRCQTVAAVLALVLMLFGTVAWADDYRDVKRDFEKAYNAAGADASARASAVMILSRNDSDRTLKILLQIAERDPSPTVRTACAGVLAGYSNAETLEDIEKAIDRERDLNVRLAIAEGMVKASHGKRIPFIRELLTHRKYAYAAVRMLVINEMRAREDKSLVPVVAEFMKALEDEDAAILAVGAEALQQVGERDQVFPALLHALRTCEGREKERVREALGKIAGGDWGNDPAKWEYWWRAKQTEEATGGAGPAMSGVKAESPPRRPPYYGIPLSSSRIVFIIDNSGSMQQPVSPQLKNRLEKEEQEEEEKEEAVITGMDAEDAEKRREEKKKEVPIDWGKINTKMDLAKAQLIKAISGLPEDVWFAVVTYNTQVENVEPRMVPATDANKQRYIAEVEKLQAQGMTNIIGALTEAMSLYKGGRVRIELKPGNMDEVVQELQTNEDLIKSGADTIFFLTDGSPTWSHTTTGQGQGTHIFTNNNGQYMNEICGDLAKQNSIRKVKVHTIGIGPHDRDLMGRLARENEGVYKDLSR